MLATIAKKHQFWHESINHAVLLSALMSMAILSWSGDSHAVSVSESDAKAILDSSLVVMDGGMGHELRRIGAPFDQSLWSARALIEAPNYVRTAHQNFIDAGAEFIITSTYSCVPCDLGEECYAQSGVELAALAAQIAREMAEQNERMVIVAGSLPPPHGSYRPDLFKAEQGRQVYKDLMQAQDQYVDVWVAETLSSLKEFEVVHDVLKYHKKPKYYSFTLNDGSVDGSPRLYSGELVADVAEVLYHKGADGVFFNCSTPESVTAAINAAKAVFDKHKVGIHIGAYANRFVSAKTDHQIDRAAEMRELSAIEYLEFAKQWQALGASIIGGCCGIEPEHIAALSQWKKEIGQDK